VAGIQIVTTVCFKLFIQILQHGMVDLDAAVAGLTDKVMMHMPGYFIYQVST
jgi:hypothetical protein